VEIGVHLPLLATAGPTMPVQDVLRYVEHANRLGFRYLAAHDHIAHPRPWLDGPTMLPAVLPRLGAMVPMTAVWLPVIRGPLAIARGLTALDLLAEGRLIAGLGAGSSEADYATAGVPFGERWQRFDEAVSFLRAVWRPDGPMFEGRFYSSKDVVLEPQPARPGGPPLWLGTWGSEAGLRRTARLADGWIASAYNTTPQLFGDAWRRLTELLPSYGKDPTQFPNALATVALYVSEDRTAVDHMLRDVLGPILHREPEELAKSLLIGSPEACAELARAYADAGCQRLLLMPVIDELEQLTLFQERVLPLLG
jgi:alkanesulfonate monooxygenase SsuD/methylene tetrahydromethanopterin reductase-like flavin-dependent oxidoreductase (luciferase family)